jgi:hypothetical protein
VIEQGEPPARVLAAQQVARAEVGDVRGVGALGDEVELLFAGVPPAPPHAGRDGQVLAGAQLDEPAVQLRRQPAGEDLDALFDAATERLAVHTGARGRPPLGAQQAAARVGRREVPLDPPTGVRVLDGLS